MQSQHDTELSGLGRLLLTHKGPVILLALGIVAVIVFWSKSLRDSTEVVHALIRAGARVELVEWSGARLYDVDFSGATVGDRELGMLAELPGVRSLDLSGTGVRDDVLPLVLKISSLTDLDLSGTQVSATGIATLRKLPTLQRLDVGRCALEDDDLAIFARFPVLDELDLSSVPLTDAGLHHLTGCARLGRLELAGTKITDAGLPTLAAIPKLHHLDIGSTNVGDLGFQALRQAVGLGTLAARSTRVTDAGMAHLPTLPALRDLDLGSCKVSDAGMRHLAAVKRLSSLALDHAPVGDVGVAHLRGLPLRKLVLSYTGVTDRSMSIIGEMSGLQHLEIDGMPLTIPAGMRDVATFVKQVRGNELGTPTITDAGLRHLNKVRGLQALRLSYAAITDAGLADLAEMTELRKLRLSGTQVSDDGMPHLRRLRHLRDLDLGSTRLTGPGLAALTGMPGLRTLSLEETRVGDSHVEHLQDLKSLTKLTLSRTDVTDAGLGTIGRITTLERLWLDGTGISDVGLAHLRSLTRLRHLTLSETTVTDAGLEHLRDLPALEEVNTHLTEVSGSAARAFLARTPPVRVLGPKEAEQRRANRPAPPDWQEEMDPARVDALGDLLPKGARARLGTARLYYPGHSCHVALTPDGGTLLAWGNGPRILAFDTRDGRVRYSLAVPEGEVRAAALSPDGKLLAACVENTIRLWQADSGKFVRELRGAWWSAMALAFAPDGRSLALTAYPGGVRILDVVTGRELLVLGQSSRSGQSQDMIGGVAFSPDGKTLAVTATETRNAPQWRDIGGQRLFLHFTSQKHVLRVYSLSSGKPLTRLEGMASLLVPGVFADGGRLFLLPGRDKTLLVLDAATWRPVRRIPWANAHYTGPVVLPDGRTVLERDDSGWRRWNVLTGRQTGRLDVYGSPVFAANGKVFATWEGEGFLSVHDAATTKELVPLVRQKHLGYPAPLTYAADGKSLAMAGDGSIRSWDIAAARAVRTIATPDSVPSSPSHSPDGKLLTAPLFRYATKEQKHTRGIARVWDAATGNVVFETPEEGWLQGTAISPCLSANGLLAVGRSAFQPGKGEAERPTVVCTLLLYDTRARGRPREIETKAERIDGVALSRDGRYVAWAGEEVGIVEAANGRIVKRVRLPERDPNTEGFHRHLTFTADGKQIAVSAGARGTLLMDRASGDVTTLSSPPNFTPCAYRSTPDGRLLVAGKATVYTSSGSASDVAVWDARTGQLLRPTWRTREVLDVTLAPDGGEVATAHPGAMVLIWPLTAP